MKKNKFNKIAYILTPIFLLFICSWLTGRKLPEKYYVSTTREQNSINYGLLNTTNFENNRFNVKMFGLINVKSASVQNVEELKVYPGGSPVGIKISTKGLLVVGYSNVETEKGNICPAKSNGIEIGDVINKVNGSELKTSKDLINLVKENKDKNIQCEIERDGKIISKTITPLKAKDSDDYKIGLWIRDTTSGVGTLTFYEPNSKKFGALGHPIADADSNKVINIDNGKLLDSTIISVKKGKKGAPGELRGIFLDESDPIGTISSNKVSGIFGTSNKKMTEEICNEPLSVGFRNEIKEGKAQIITTLEGEEPKYYDIEITKLLPQNEAGPKSMLIKVTDKELLEKTGGIVQGMSGSPIIQNNKIVGAVTHVLVNNPEVGYGIYIEWMLQDAEILRK